MQLLRNVLIALYFLSLPFYGQASVVSSGHCCMQMTHDRDMAQMGSGHCCHCQAGHCHMMHPVGNVASGHSASHSGHSGQTDACGQGCDACNVWQPLALSSFVAVSPPFVLTQSFFSSPPLALFDRRSEDFWRPPRV